MMTPLLRSRNVAIERSTVSCPIHGDAELLKQALMNIMMNAVQAMPEGGLIGITLTRSERDGTVHISDSGTGIAQENVEKIFDPFFTTKDSGTGLGLAITAKIMQAHNGGITMRSEAGKGSTFSLLFPSTEASIVSDSAVLNNKTAVERKNPAFFSNVHG